MSGCAVCVYDLYEESLVAYKESLSSLKSSLSALKIPEWEWPQVVQTTPGQDEGETNGKRKDNVTLSAFEELERSLNAKRAQGS